MINKKDKKGLCPFMKLKECDERCMFYRKGVRFNELSNESFPFESCAINIIADNLEAMHQRTYAMQKEVGDTKNVITLKILSEMGLCKSGEVERQARKMMDLPTDDQILIEDSTEKVEE